MIDSKGQGWKDSQRACQQRHEVQWLMSPRAQRRGFPADDRTLALAALWNRRALNYFVHQCFLRRPVILHIRVRENEESNFANLFVDPAG